MRRAAIAAAAAMLALATAARAQPPSVDGQVSAPYGAPVNDDRVYVHGLLSEFEGRLGADDSFRWEGEGWVGGDLNRLWLKSEGEATRGVVSDGQQEAFYDRPVTTYFDLQAGARYDLDSYAGRGWAALGVEGFAPYYADVSATAYASDAGHYAAKIEAADELRFTQRLILEPQAEIDLYTRDDPARRIGSGLSSLDAGLRLRYEIVRKFAPYVGVVYERAYGRTADYAKAVGDRPEDLRLALGIRSWF